MYCIFTHSIPFTLSLFLSLLVPAMPQFDPGLGGIISDRQRVWSEVWDRVCQRWQVRDSLCQNINQIIFIDTHICVCLSRTQIICLLHSAVNRHYQINICCVAVWCFPTTLGLRSPLSSTSARCRGWRCHIQTRLGDHDSTDFMEYKVFYSCILLVNVASDVQA